MPVPERKLSAGGGQAVIGQRVEVWLDVSVSGPLHTLIELLLLQEYTTTTSTTTTTTSTNTTTTSIATTTTTTTTTATTTSTRTYLQFKYYD